MQGTGTGSKHLPCPGAQFGHAEHGAHPLEGHLKGPSFCVTYYSGLMPGCMDQTSPRGPTFPFSKS